MRWTTASAGLFGILLLVGCLGSPGSAAPDPATPPTDGPVYLQQQAHEWMLSATGSPLRVARPRGAESAQQWRLERSGEHFQIAQSGRCAVRTDGTVTLGGCDQASGRWLFESSGGDGYRLRDPDSDAYLLGVPADQLDQPVRLGNGDDPLSRWYVTPIEPEHADMPPEDQRTFDQLTFLTAHNAFANPYDNGIHEIVAPSQRMRIEDQLKNGVRSLMLDINWAKNKIYLCHGKGCNEPIEEHRTFESAMTAVVRFMKENPREFITVFLEDYTARDQLESTLGSVAGLKNLAFDPATADVKENGWPKVTDLIAQDKRLLILTANPGNRIPGVVVFQHDWTVENTYGEDFGQVIGDPNFSCSRRTESRPINATEPGFRRLFVMNHFRVLNLFPDHAERDNGQLRRRAERYCLPAARRKPNFLAVNLVTKGSPAPIDTVQRMNTYDYVGATAEKQTGDSRAGQE